MPDWFNKVIQDKIQSGFTGSLKVNFANGSIGNINEDKNNYICPQCGIEAVKVEEYKTLKER